MAVLLPGQQPIVVRRVNYFESPKFAGFFDPHPGYSSPPTLLELAKLRADELAAEEEAKRLAEEERLKAEQRARDLAVWKARDEELKRAAWVQYKAIAVEEWWQKATRLTLLITPCIAAALIGLLVLAVCVLGWPPFGWWLIGTGSAAILVGGWVFVFWFLQWPPFE